MGRLEWGVGNASTDFDLLLLEAVLKDNDVPCEFFPHRPNEGYNMGRVIPLGVWLYVPDEYAEAAEQFALDVAESRVVEDDADGADGDAEYDDGADADDLAGDDLGDEEDAS